LQFKAQILSIDPGEGSSNDVEPGNDGDVEPTDEDQTVRETSVSNVIS